MKGSPDISTADTSTNDRPEDDERRASGSWIVRSARVVLRLIDEKARRRPSPRAERLLLGVAFVAFVVMGVAAATNFPDVGTGIRWEILVPVGIIGNALNLFL